jgi:hypothetical protein
VLSCSPIVLCCVVVCCAQGRKGEKRATLNQLLEDLQRALKKAGNSSGSSLLTREEQEWLVQEMLLQGLLTFEFGFTAYNTNTYLVATPAASSLARQRWEAMARHQDPTACSLTMW